MPTRNAPLDRTRKLLATATARASPPGEAEALTANAAQLMATDGIDRAFLAAEPETDQGPGSTKPLDRPVPARARGSWCAAVGPRERDRGVPALSVSQARSGAQPASRAADAPLTPGVQDLFPGRGLRPLGNILPARRRPVALPPYDACVPSAVGTPLNPRTRDPPLRRHR